MASLFLTWLYGDAPGSFLTSSRQLTLALYNFFSIPLLTKTLFDPWRHDSIDMTRLPINYWFQAFNRNLISRLVGVVVRSSTIFAGLVTIFIYNLGFLVFIVLWYSLPLLLLISVVFGVELMLGISHGF